MALRFSSLRLAVTAGLLGLVAPLGGAQPRAIAQDNAASVPDIARAAGFLQKTFETRQFSAATVDTASTQAKGYQWYFWNMFGHVATAANSHMTLSGDGAVTLGGGPGGNGAMMSGVPVKGGPGFVGRAFGGGGYFEAELRFDPDGISGKQGWPAWWMMSAEHLWLLPTRTWPGEHDPTYEHFIEIDAFELIRPLWHPHAYMSSAHDWYGIFHKTCGMKKVFCAVDTPYHSNIVPEPDGQDWKQWHRMGMRWVPATATRRGEITYWLDGRQIGQTITFAQHRDGPPPVQPLGDQPFSWVDRQHLVLLFGSSADGPMTVRRVSVWQASAAGNLNN